MSILKSSTAQGVSLAALLFLSLSNSATAEGEKTPKPLHVTINQGTLMQSQTVPTVAEAERRINQTPGGVALLSAEQFNQKYVQNFQDSLAYVPGVFAQKRYGEEVRLSIRGSGISRGFHLRGITLLQDGIPFNLADGSGDFQEADPLSLQHIEVYKGANALQYGGNGLGGAVNLVSPTGYTAPGTQLRVEAGTDNTYRTNIRTGGVMGATDGFLSLTATDSNGFRQHSDQSNIKLNTNVGVKLSDRLETRFYLSSNVIEQDLPGTLTRANALSGNRTRAGGTSITDDQKRDIRSVRLSNKTSYMLNNDQTIEGGVFANYKELFHPIASFIGTIDQESVDYGGFGALKGNGQVGSFLSRYRVGFTSQANSVDALVFGNRRGNRGATIANPAVSLASDADQKAETHVLYGENSLYVTPELAVVTGGQLTWAAREVFDNTRNRNDERTYRAFNPKVGLLYEPIAGRQFYTNLSKATEAPTFSELTQSGTGIFTPIEAQRSWTFEVGTRGSEGRVSWDLSVYRSWLRNEFLQFTPGVSGVPASIFNAGKTMHQGIELGFDVKLTNEITWQNAYTFSNFKFKDDVQYDDNDIAGVPPHFYKTALRYQQERFYVAPNLEWVPVGAQVDYANTTDAGGYAILGAEAGYNLTDNVTVYVEGRNLTDETYISNFSTTNAANANSALYYPGDGISAFAGVTVRF